MIVLFFFGLEMRGASVHLWLAWFYELNFLLKVLHSLFGLYQLVDYGFFFQEESFKLLSH